jgi:uncharacterized YigZ family protein
MTPDSDTYLTIGNRSTGSYYERKSRFIGIAVPVTSEVEIKNTLNAVKKEYYDAVHHCYAWEILNDPRMSRHSDDGEPSGSAGVQIYNTFCSKKITNILVVVVRYYGGIKLGVPGLIKAYRTATAEALGNASVIEKCIETPFSACFPYAVLPEISKTEKKLRLNRMSESYTGDSCIVTWKTRRSEAENCINIMKGIHGVTITPEA